MVPPFLSQPTGTVHRVTYQSLYRRYRPQRFGDVLGQDHVSATLRNAVRTGKVAHAYLFSGPRGCGKTTSARILAKALNCTDLRDGEPCDVCESCRLVTSGASMDVSELDAASNNGVDAMRELVARASLGTAGRRKVYIIDEVHMLSTAASNALLKTLEEPPDHVVFVLATTDPQKVLPTIRSRTQHFEFRLFPIDTLIGLVRSVAVDAGLGLDEATIEAVARKGNGSARDALSALDQVAAAGGIEDSFDVTELAHALAEREATAVLSAVDRAVDRGRDPRQLTRDLVEALREAFLVHMGLVRPAADGELVRRLGPAAITRAIEQLGEALVVMRDSLDPRITLEVALVRLVRSDLDTSPAALAERLEQIERRLAVGGVEPTMLPVPPVVMAPLPVPTAPLLPQPGPRPSTPRMGTSAAEAEHVAPTDPQTPAAELPTDTPAPVPPPSLPPLTTTVPPPGPALRADMPVSSLPSLRAPISETKPVAAATRGGAADGARAVLGSRSGAPARPMQAAGSGAGAEVLAPGSSFATEALPTPAGTPAPVGPPAPFGEITTDALNAAKEHMLELLDRKGKILLAAGRFLHGDATTAVFGLPNPMHLQRCVEWRGPWESVVRSYTGASLGLSLVVDPQGDGPIGAQTVDAAVVPALQSVSEQSPTMDDPEHDIDDFDPSELIDVPAAAIPTTLDHLTKAFPGAQVVDDGQGR